MNKLGIFMNFLENTWRADHAAFLLEFERNILNK